MLNKLINFELASLRRDTFKVMWTSIIIVFKLILLAILIIPTFVLCQIIGMFADLEEETMTPVKKLVKFLFPA